jgi:hypothetical protein
MKKLLAISASVAATAAPVSLAFAGPAVASSRASMAGGAPHAVGTAATPRMTSGTPTNKSTTFAGYAHNGGGEFAKFKLITKFVVPKVSCTSTTKGIAPAINDVADVGVFVGCYKGKATYFPFIFINGSEKNYVKVKVHAGDHIVLHASAGPKATSASFVDATRKITKKKTGPGVKGAGFPSIGDDSWFISGQELRVPKFRTVRFSDCQVNGRALGAGGSRQVPAVLRYNRVSPSGVLQISTGKLSSARNAFTTYFKHS